MGNIRRNTPERTMILARRGFFSLTFNAEDRPAGWPLPIQGSVPVFDGRNPNVAGTPPNRWETIYWFIPPTPRAPSPTQEYPTFQHITIGRPRIELNNVNNPSSIPA
jgi:hypothetical protein